MPRNIPKLDSNRFLIHIPVLLCLVTVLPGLFLSFEDSEIWGITSSRRLIDHPFVGTSAHFKPLFSLLFGTIATLAKSDWSALMTSRWLALTFTAGGLFSLYSMGLNFLPDTRRRAITIASYAIVCTMPLLILHFTKARSDSIAASIILIGGFLLLQFEDRSTLWRGCVYVVASVLALLTTPKSIDLTLSLGILFWMSDHHRDGTDSFAKYRPKGRLFTRILWVVGPVALIFLVSLLISRDFIAKSFIYWIDSYDGGSTFSHLSWISFERAVITAPFASLLLGVGLVFGMIGFRNFERRERALVLSGLVVLTFIAIHSQKYLFFLASRVPFLAIGALPGIHLAAGWLQGKWKWRPSTVLGLFITLFVVSLGLTLNRLHRYPGFQIDRQKEVYHSVEAFLDRAGTNRYWDAIGLFPTRNLIFHYPSPADRTNDQMLGYVELSHPTLILRTSKMELLEPFFMVWLRDRYVHLNEEIYLRYQLLPKDQSCEIAGSEILRLAQEQGFQLPVALVTRSAALGQWVRVPFSNLNGSEVDTLSTETISEFRMKFRVCDEDRHYAITEAKPWNALPAPYFSLLFGYDGRL